MNDPMEQLGEELDALKPAPLSESTEARVRASLASVPATSQRRSPLMWVLVASVLACLAIGALTAIFRGQHAPQDAPIAVEDPKEVPKVTPEEKDEDRDPAPRKPVEPVVLAQLDPAWHLDPTGDADYRVVDPRTIELLRGEVFLKSKEPGNSAPPLTVQTPSGKAVAQGTSFYIGTHETTTQPEKAEEMKNLTRVFVLSGIVLLGNSLGEVTGVANELLAAESGRAPTKLAVAANSDFAIDLYRQLVKEKGNDNLFFSPYSISTALAMTAEGARGETAEEMGKVLRFSTAIRRVGDDAQMIPWRTSMIHTGLAELNRKLTGSEKPGEDAIRKKIVDAKRTLEAAKARLQQLQKDQKWRKMAEAMEEERKAGEAYNKLISQVDQYELRVANALWGEQTYPFKKNYIDTISGYYDTGGVFPVDFKNNFAAAKKRIDAWTAKNTNDRIKEIVPKLSPEEARLMRLILTNAIYFKGDWATPFKEEQTKDRDFTLVGGDKKQTPIMLARDLKTPYAAFNADGSRFNTPTRIRPGQKKGCYPEGDGFAMVELPYKGDDLSMVVIAPNSPDGLPAIEKQLTPESLKAWIGELKPRKTHVYLPKFKLETKYKMNDTLKAMGMPRAFTDPRQPNGADFTGMSDSPSLMDRLYIAFVVHKAFVEVNEKGTEAAAVTAVGAMGLTSMPIDIPFIPEFRADRPFIYLIREKSTGSILFLGRMMNPAEK